MIEQEFIITYPKPMEWQPIDDLPQNWQAMASSELPPLVTVWNEQADRLRESGAFKAFMAKMRREIAIETGIIERLYTIDRGITRLLIEQGIDEALIPHGATDRPPKEVIALIRDQEAAVEGLFDFVGGQRSLTSFYIKQLHQVLTGNQATTEAIVPSTGEIIRIPLLRGEWKKWPNNPLRPDGKIHEYSPPEQVASEIDNLIQWHYQHQQSQVAPEVEAAWLHHRFTQIHPFQDGNGRVARCLGSLVFIQAGWFPLVLTRDDRFAYIAALEEADGGDLSSLINLFAESQKQGFIRSLSLSGQVLSETRQTRSILESITETLKQRQSASISERCKKAEEYAATLFDVAFRRFQYLSAEIKIALQNVVPDANIYANKASATDERSYYHRYQIIEVAKKQRYFANLQSYNSWVRLAIEMESRTEMLLSFHVLGREHLGILVCSACAYRKDSTEEGEANINDIQPLTESPFQFSYADEVNHLQERFSKWLEEAIVTGLEYWRKDI
ncbi:Fic family protein [Argonema galeatum]|uniref:Fic family protein n=1 Tax=Argonema galeatum TaxID=2942762 RepID=UPI0020132FA6|nr:Fic family protein [Argonema galeatum]MCL1467954.1 Fic family protein [Argonema galeatum A003/A1]